MLVFMNRIMEDSKLNLRNKEVQKGTMFFYNNSFYLNISKDLYFYMGFVTNRHSLVSLGPDWIIPVCLCSVYR